MAVYKAEHDGFHVTEPNTELDTDKAMARDAQIYPELPTVH